MSIFEGFLYMIWRGIAIGVIISAPMGPVGILCIQRTLEKGRKTGFFTGIGAALSDLFYCLITGFGLSFIEDFLQRNHDVIQLAGSIVLIAFGLYIFKSNPSRKLRKPGENRISAKKNILNGFIFTFSNPLIIFLIIGLFARFNFMRTDLAGYHYFVGFLAIIAGALGWWYIVTFFVNKVRAHFNLRSMWLINKITGSAIMIFGVVGIVTAIAAMAHAQEPTQTYYNPSRGFHQFNCVSDSVISISNSSDKLIYDMIPVAASSDLVFSFRATNKHNAVGKKYAFSDNNGKSIKVAYPAWGIRLADKGGAQTLITIKTIDKHTEENYSQTSLNITASTDGREVTSTNVTSGVDFFNGTNAFCLKKVGNKIFLRGGNREYIDLIAFESTISSVDSIGFFATPAAEICIPQASLEYASEAFLNKVSIYGNQDILDTQLLRSSDPIEGIWQVFDRSLDEDRLKLGGDYRLAIVKEEPGYDIIYISGAVTNSQNWKQGMIKGHLYPTSFNDTFDVEWFDAMGAPLNKEIKAQYSKPLITITFPYQSSSLRLRKETKKAGS